MGDVVANMSMSLDNFVDDTGGGVDQVFAWLYGSGNLGLLAAISGDLVPVLLGSRTPFFANLQQRFALGTPSVIEGHGVTPLRYRGHDKA